MKIILYSIIYLSISCFQFNANADAINTETQTEFNDQSMLDYEKQIKYHDPFESFNRVVFAFNQIIDFAVLRPVITIYDIVVFDKAKTNVSNFLDNLSSPITAVNDILSVEPANLFRTLSRFVINSTIGILGLFDPASNVFHITKHKQGFGDTLRKWGLSPGPYLVLPIIGSSSFLESIGMLADYFSDPYNRYMWNINNKQNIQTRSVAQAISTRHRLDDIITQTNNSNDPYSSYRLLYMQNKQIITEPEDTIIPDDVI